MNTSFSISGRVVGTTCELIFKKTKALVFQSEVIPGPPVRNSVNSAIPLPSNED